MLIEPVLRREERVLFENNGPKRSLWIEKQISSGRINESIENKRSCSGRGLILHSSSSLLVSLSQWQLAPCLHTQLVSCLFCSGPRINFAFLFFVFRGRRSTLWTLQSTFRGRCRTLWMWKCRVGGWQAQDFVSLGVQIL